MGTYIDKIVKRFGLDISHVVSVLSRHVARPCTKVIEAAKRIIKYLAGTQDFAITWMSSALEEEQG
jgi:hypothetical protein